MQALMLKQLVTLHIGPIDLQIERGQSIGLYGPSGAGKSLLLRTIADLDPHQGEISLNGVSQLDIPATEWRSRVAYCAAESQWWGAEVRDHLPVGVDNSRITSLLQRCGFGEESLGWSIERLSSGEKQRLSLLRQLIRTPEVLLLDEPTANLDPENSQQIEQLLLQDQQQRGTTILWVSHDRQQLMRCCSCHYPMRQGQLQSPTESNHGDG
ncbi:MAG: ATP-binding cassette domain-containing protein [Gammaproteobacteria bacterium]|jgi:putative ABC transport system ATP-binding protein|nr:ATP-binding cassette domain-containing protein [Gammaproteobacteria bacterium]MBT7308277.1 ATP-binding cassette domain-containing protein [Gammaproteobacteria bacterium]